MQGYILLFKKYKTDMQHVKILQVNGAITLCIIR